MVSFEEKDRHNIQDILKSDFFGEIKGISNEKQKELIKDEFKLIEILLNNTNNKNVNYNQKDIKEEDFGENKIFDEKTKIRCIKNENIYEYYIKINGSLSAIDFMKEYPNEMGNLFDEIKPNKKYLKYNIIIKNEEYEEEKENVKELNNNNSFELENINERNKNIIIKVELLKLKDNEFLLNFIKGNGGLRDYYEYLTKVMKYAEDFL